MENHRDHVAILAYCSDLCHTLKITPLNSMEVQSSTPYAEVEHLYALVHIRNLHYVQAQIKGEGDSTLFVIIGFSCFYVLTKYTS